MNYVICDVTGIAWNFFLKLYNYFFSVLMLYFKFEGSSQGNVSVFKIIALKFGEMLG